MGAPPNKELRSAIVHVLPMPCAYTFKQIMKKLIAAGHDFRPGTVRDTLNRMYCEGNVNSKNAKIKGVGRPVQKYYRT